MAIYHFHAKVLKRSQGHSAVAAAAYRSGQILYDERHDMVHDYHNRRGVVQSFILAPDNAPEWMKDRQTLWHAVEASERRKDAQLAREVEVSLPRELDMATNKALVKEFVGGVFVEDGMIADVSIHNGLASDGGDQPHAHILLTMRDIEGDTFGQKNRDWNDKDKLMNWREAWAEHANRYLEEAGSDERIDHRTLVDQGIERLPTVHMGKDAKAMEDKGIQTERGDKNREIVLENTAFALLPEVKQWAQEALDYFAEEPELAQAVVEPAPEVEGWFIAHPSEQQWASDFLAQIAEDKARQERIADEIDEIDEIELEPHIHDHAEPDRGLELGR